MLKYLIYICITLIFSASLLFGVTKTFTGLGMDYNWDNPTNWDPPGVPTLRDSVVIPADVPYVYLKPERNGQCLTMKNYSTILPAGTRGNIGISARYNIENHGQMVNPNGTMELFSHHGDVSNEGLVRGKEAAIIGRNFHNTLTGRVEGAGNNSTWNTGVVINVNNFFYNQGVVSVDPTTIDGQEGDAIEINASRLNNENTISAGMGGLNGAGGPLKVKTKDPNSVNTGIMRAGNGRGEAPGWGGDTYLSGKGFINNNTVAAGEGVRGGTIYVDCSEGMFSADGRTNGGMAIGPDPNGNINIFTQVANLSSEARAGLPTEKSPLEPTYGNISIIGDSIQIHPGDSSISGDTIVIMGNKIVIYDILGPANFFCNNLIQIYTSPGGYIDLSGTHTIGSLYGGAGSIEFYSDSIIAPPEGLDYICNPDPIINPADTSIKGGLAFIDNDMDTAGHSDSLEIAIQNQSTLPRAFDYSVFSAKGWITPVSGTTPIIEPFNFFSFNNDYEIANGSFMGESDTVTIIIELTPGVAETTFSFVKSFGNFSTQDTFTFVLFEGWNMLSFPFFDTHQMTESFPMMLGDAWAYVGPDSGYTAIPSAWAGPGFWILSPSDTTIEISGLYEADTIDYNFEPGWHMIGGPADTISAEALTDLEAVWEDIFGYDPILRRYAIVDFLSPGFSYWIFIEDTVEFILP